MKIYFKRKPLDVKVKRVSSFGKFIGLMFKSAKSENLLFEFDYPGRIRIHSYFVFFKFTAVWLDKKNNVLEAEIVEPFRLNVRPKKPVHKLVEIPLNKKNLNLVRILVEGERFKY